MPLNCDCYGGCWADHSKDWPRLGDAPWIAETFFAVARQHLPYGTYVCMGDHIRLETEEIKERLLSLHERTYDASAQY